MLSWRRAPLAIFTAAFALAIIPTRLPAEPAIWHISDTDSDIYIFGTVHILPPDLVWRTSNVEEAFDHSDTVWFEAPANDPESQMQMLGLIQQFGLNPATNPLSAQISPDGRAALDKVASEVGLPLASLEPLRPWFAAVTLTAAYIQSQGFDANSGVEAQLWPLARERGKAIDYFETLEEQLRFFADLPREVEIGLFEQTVIDFEDDAGELDTLVRAWENGRIDEIDDLVNDDMRRTVPEVYDVVIAQRNEEWVNRIEALLAGAGSHFIALGAGHLAGADGVIERLRAEGVVVSGP